jgi:hypothetical protein
MSDDLKTLRSELERVQKVSDMLCSAHSVLRDRYARRALLLDITILATSTWIIALVFVDPVINVSLTPFKMVPQIWIGLISTFAFFLTIVQMRADWPGKSNAHHKSFQMYAEVKQGCRQLLSGCQNITPKDCQTILTQYGMATKIGTDIPDSDFLKQKQRHRIKVAISRHLDSHPGASILFTKIKIFFRDNFGSGETNNGEGP